MNDQRNDDQGAEPQNDLVRLCPVCGAALVEHRAHGVRVDACEAHGMWLDVGELELILLRRAQRRHPSRSRELQDSFRKVRIDGWLWGVSPEDLDP